MKILALLMLVCIATLSASPGYTQNERISVHLQQSTLRDVFREIERLSDYSIFYNDHFLDLNKVVNVDHHHLPIKDILNGLLEETDLSYKLLEGNLIVITPQEQDEQVGGRVIDENGKALPGVTIMIKNTGRGTITDLDGYFRLDANTGDILVFSCIGMETREVVASDQRYLVISLDMSAAFLSEVVVVSTGYQSISRERSAGAFYNPDITTISDRSSSMSVLARLDGLVPGLTINNAPNAGNNPVLIRGLTTIGVEGMSNTFSGTNRSPLYVVDGIAFDDISFVNPQDVDQISVLKDATSASIWGSRASNGVIVITTKKGRPSDKIKVTYDGFINFQGKPDLNYLPGLSSEQFIQAAREVFDPVAFPWASTSAFVNLGGTAITPHEMILYNLQRGLITESQANKSLDSLASINNLGQISDLWYRDAAMMNHTVTLSGGGQVHTFYGSLAATDTQSNRPGEANNTYKFNLRQDLQLNKNLSLFLITDLSNTRYSSKGPLEVVSHSIPYDNRFVPYQLFQDGNGQNLSVPYLQPLSDSTRIAFEERSRISLDYNPMDEFDYGHSQGDMFFSRITGGATVKLIDGLRFEGVYGYVKGKNKLSSFDDLKSYLVRSEIVQFTVAPTAASTPVYYLPTNGGRYTLRQSDENSWTIRNQMVYDQNWDYKHQVTLLAGHEAQEKLYTSAASTVRGYNEQLLAAGRIDYLALGSGVRNPVMPNNIGRSVLQTFDVLTQSEDRVRFVSYYANAAYSYNLKYSVNASWRIDQSNLFGLDKSAQNRPVWSSGLKWVISREGFMEDLSWLNFLAFRATYGITGNAPDPKTAASQDILRTGQSNFLPGGVGVLIATPANRKLTWESTESVNLGIDFTLLNHRMNGSVDVYNKNTTDLIGYMPVNPFSGYATIVGNMGDLNNKGIEISLRTLNLSMNGFSWYTTLVMAYNENKVTNLQLQSPIATGNQKVTRQFLTDFPAFSVFAYRYAGLDILGDPQVYLSDESVSKMPNITMPEDIDYLGTFQPPWSGGLSNTFGYKGFEVSVNMVYNLGHVIRRPVNTFFTGRLALTNPLAEFADRWKEPGDENHTSIPSFISNRSLSSSRRSIEYYYNGDLNVINASYVKVRDITFAYSLPKEISNRLKAEHIRLRMQVSNLMLWKANDYGIDPEFIGTMPVNQGTFTLGLNVAF
jgi:TonB-linked SusC/RagA family outer membrane protein